MLYQIRRCSAPCTGEITLGRLRQAGRGGRDFLSGKSRAVMAGSPPKCEAASRRWSSSAPRGCATASGRSRRSRETQSQSADRSPRPTCSRLTRRRGQSCVQVFFFRAGQNWGNRAYFPRVDRAPTPEPRCWPPSSASSTRTSRRRAWCLVSHAVTSAGLLAEAFALKAGRKIEIARAAARREAGARRPRAAQRARGAGRARWPRARRRRSCWRRSAETFGLEAARRADRGLRQLPHHGDERGRRR